MFYPDDPGQCRAQAKAYTTLTASGLGEAAGQNWIGGVVPHAGWICSGALAGQTIATLGSGGGKVDLVVVFGAIHTPIPTQLAVLDSFAKWDVPGDSCEIQNELRARLLGGAAPGSFMVDDRFHFREHAVEVELPLIRSVWPDAAILPVEVPAVDSAVQIGRATARLIAQTRQAKAGAGRAVFLASSDLTHYGVNYGFMPAGIGLVGMQWAKQNDRPLIEKILKLQAEAIVPEVRAHLNACGAGAIAAMLAACKELGAGNARLLRHATSFETLANVAPQSPDNAVGYASIVVG
jgi:AmmeMemoRadiSam system protein B